MSLALHVAPEPMTEVVAFAEAVHVATGATVHQFVRCLVPVDLLKSEAGGRVYHDADGTFRWLTVRPNGPGTEGQPIKVRESKTEKGVWHVVGGAGGKLNYMKIHLGTVDEMKARAEKKRQARAQAEKDRRQIDADRKRNLSAEERKAEAEQARHQAEQREAARTELRTRQQEQIAAVAQHLGWDEGDWKFDATRDRLQAAGASAERIAALEAQHHQRIYRRVEDVLAQTKRALIAERERAAGSLPLTTDDPETVALTDLLDGPQTPKGRGYQSITKASSDAEIRAALAATDVAALADELHALEAADPLEHPEAAAQIADLRAQIHTAELIAKAETMAPAEIDARKTAVAEALTAAHAAQGEYRAELTALRTKLRADGPALTAEESVRLEVLEQRQAEDLRHVQRLKGEAIDLAVMAGETVAPVVTGEKGRVAAAKQAEREAAIRAEQGEDGVATYRALREKMRAGAAAYQAEMEHYRATGALRRPEVKARPLTDPEAALHLLAKQKALATMERQLRDEAPDRDLEMFGKGYFDAVGQPTPAMIAAVERDVTNALREQATRAFLARADSPELLLGRSGRYSDDVTPRTMQQAMERHLSAGAYHALNNAALAATKTPVLSREVVDTLGAAGAAQLLAATIAQHETPATLKAMAASLGDYHVAAHVEQSEERLREVEEALDQADEAIAGLTNPADVAVALAANQRRQVKLEEARQTLGVDRRYYRPFPTGRRT